MPPWTYAYAMNISAFSDFINLPLPHNHGRKTKNTKAKNAERTKSIGYPPASSYWKYKYALTNKCNLLQLVLLHTIGRILSNYRITETNPVNPGGKRKEKKYIKIKPSPWNRENLTKAQCNCAERISPDLNPQKSNSHCADHKWPHPFNSASPCIIVFHAHLLTWGTNRWAGRINQVYKCIINKSSHINHFHFIKANPQA